MIAVVETVGEVQALTATLSQVPRRGHVRIVGDLADMHRGEYPDGNGDEMSARARDVRRTLKRRIRDAETFAAETRRLSAEMRKNI